jgi:uncharacterized protein YbaR (Trm112 family)
MGLFDYIVGTCPSCQGRLYGQTKGGDCSLNTYQIEDEMDASDAMAVDGEWLTCNGCDKAWRVRSGSPEKVRVVLEEVDMNRILNPKR